MHQLRYVTAIQHAEDQTNTCNRLNVQRNVKPDITAAGTLCAASVLRLYRPLSSSVFANAAAAKLEV
jgi:hypothetical protein